MSRWQRRAGDERGAVLALVALSMVALIASTALAVDIGQLTVKNRDLQKVADAVALDATRALNGSNAGSLSASSGGITVAVQGSAARNDFPYAQLQVELGTKGSGAFVPAPTGSTIPNAVRVTATGTVDYAFAVGGKTTSRMAVAVKEDTVGFSIGSFLASLNPPGNRILDAIFGESFDVNVLSYDGLVGANLTLKAIGLNWPVTALSPTEVLNTSVSVKNLMLASASALSAQGNTAAATVLNNMALSITSTTMIKLADSIKLNAGGEQAAADAQLNVLQMLTAAALVADGTHALSIPASQLSIPGVGDVTVALDVISMAQTLLNARVGDSLPPADQAPMNQFHLTVTPQIHITTSSTVNGCSLQSLLGGLLSLSVGELLTCTLGGVVNRVISLDLNASIPIDIQIAGAQATLTNITCSSPQSITLQPTLQPLILNSNVDLTFTGTLLGNSLGNVLRVQGSAGAHAQSTPPAQVFLHPSEFGVTRTVGSNTLSAAGMTSLTATNTTVLNANVGPVASVLSTAVLSIVNSTMTQLDTKLLGALQHLLGLNIGGADLTAINNTLLCGRRHLVE